MESGRSSSNVNEFDLNVAVGYLSTLKKSPERRCLLNISMPLLTEAMSMDKFIEPVFACMSSTILPVIRSNRTSCLENPKCVYENLGYVCSGSTELVTG